MRARILVFTLLVTSTAWAVEGDSLWSRTFGGPSQEIAYSLIETNDGGFLLSGSSNGLLLVKTDSNGDSVWS